MARADKAAAVAQITEDFRDSSATVLTEYRGLSVGKLKELRRSLGPDTTYAVVKNTLTKIAASEAGVTGVDDLLAGPTAIAFIKGDAVAAAKSIDKFAKENPLLVIKGGVMDGKVLTAADIKKLASLESREVLLSKVAGAANAALAKAAALFQAPLSQAARTVEALRVAAESNPALIAGAGTPAPAPVVEEAGVEVAEEAVADEVVADVTEEVEAPVAQDTTEEAPAGEESAEETTEG